MFAFELLYNKRTAQFARTYPDFDYSEGYRSATDNLTIQVWLYISYRHMMARGYVCRTKIGFLLVRGMEQNRKYFMHVWTLGVIQYLSLTRFVRRSRLFKRQLAVPLLSYPIQIFNIASAYMNQSYGIRHWIYNSWLTPYCITPRKD